MFKFNKTNGNYGKTIYSNEVTGYKFVFSDGYTFWGVRASNTINALGVAQAMVRKENVKAEYVDVYTFHKDSDKPLFVGRKYRANHRT